MNCNLAVIKGDGIGPEIVTEAMSVLDAVGEKYGHTFSYTQILMGGASIDVHGEPLTEEALEIAKKSDAVLMGSIGGNTSTSPWYKLPAQLRPEAGLLKLRKSLGLFANIRPAYLYDELKKACPLRDEVIGCLLYTSVAYTASCMAMVFGVDVHKAYRAGLLHDCAKGFSMEKQIALCKRYNISLEGTLTKSPQLMHQEIAPFLASDEYKEQDSEVLSAIACHTTGKIGMTPLEQIVFIADYMEPVSYTHLYQELI